MRAEIIAVGSELLTSERLDTNSLFLTDQLNRIGIRVVHKAVVGDGPDEMTSSFQHALDRADVIVSSGGLGPTDDDRTRTTVAQLLGRKLHCDNEILSDDSAESARHSAGPLARSQRPHHHFASRRSG
jgi:nicotinamide-nucleotide amidase